MEFQETELKDVLHIYPKIHRDDRGYFLEAYNEREFKENGIPSTYVQDNQSFSKKGVLRGLHFQYAPYAQGKLVSVVTGSAQDVVVDIRPESPTFMQHQSFVLEADKRNMVYVPEGFAHGFLALEDTIFCYKCTNFYHKASEGGIYWNDPALNIDWQIKDPVVSEKDRELPFLEKLELEKRV